MNFKPYKGERRYDMKTVKAYEVGGELFKDKKAAEKAEAERKRTMERAKLIIELNNVCKKLGIEMPWPPEETPAAAPHKATKSKFKVGDRVRILTEKSDPYHMKEGKVTNIYEDSACGHCIYVSIDDLRTSIPYRAKSLSLIKDIPPKFKVGDKVKVIKHKPAKV